ncbi:hypothetical protein Tco_0014686 [Tanacetum coccineum]
MEMAIFSEKSALWRKVIKDFCGDDDGFNSHPIFKGYHGAWSDIIKAVSHIEESWRIPPRGRAFDNLASLISIIGNLVLSTNGVDNWVWDRDASSFFKVKVLFDNLQEILLSNYSIGPHHVWNS